MIVGHLLGKLTHRKYRYDERNKVEELHIKISHCDDEEETHDKFDKLHVTLLLGCKVLDVVVIIVGVFGIQDSHDDTKNQVEVPQSSSHLQGKV